MRRARYARMAAKRRIDRTRGARRARLLALWLKRNDPNA